MFLYQKIFSIKLIEFFRSKIICLPMLTGKDTIIFLSKEELDEPSQIKLEYEKEDEEHMGLIKPDGEINWNCPCLQGMADGPCGQEFRASFSCFHFSEADPKGSDCIDQFRYTNYINFSIFLFV